MTSIAVIPELEKTNLKLAYNPTPEEQERGVKIHRRLDQMYTAKAPYIPQIERGIMLYDGYHLPDTKKKGTISNDNLVAPYARIFVDTKTAEEVKAFSEYVFTPVEDSGDAWKVDLLKDVNNHIRRKVKQRTKRHDMLRMKNIAGVGIARVGYRKIMGKRKIRTETNDDGDILNWEEKSVPIYDDIFMDVVSPLNFLVDPNATTMEDAMDCAYFHSEHIDQFKESYGSELYKNVDQVMPGVQGTYGAAGFFMGQIGNFSCQEDMVVVCEYFNKILDCWIVYANGVEIFYGALPDDHKELPFFSYHNNPSFCTGFMELTTRTVNGEEVAMGTTVSADRSFWTVGDPSTIFDLIELRTAHGRAAHRLIKRASQRIIATRGQYRLPTDRNWQDGDEATGAMGQLEVLNLAGGGAGAGDWQWAFDDLFQLMRLTIGVDPSNLAETKQKTATEAEIQMETAQRRLDMGLEYNEENGEVRFGTLVHKLIQQRYSKPELKRLLGDESAEELKDFDEVEKDSGGRPIYGKRYRRIKSTKNILESQKAGKYSISESDAGVSSFIARPEYIRTSDMDVAVESGRKASQMRSIWFKKYMDALNVVANLVPYTQVNPNTGKALIDIEDLPPLKEISKGLMKALDLKYEKEEIQSEEDKKIEEALEQRKKRTPMDMMQGMPQEMPQIPQGMPQMPPQNAQIG